MLTRQKTLAFTALVAMLALLVAAPVAGGQKLKQKKKEKRFEPVVKQNVAEYAGRYVGLMPDYYLEITATPNDTLSVVSQEGGRRATLRDIRLAGARLTATRVYADGTTGAFEATFVNRIANGESSFGVMVENVDVKFEDITFNHVFYRLDPGRGSLTNANKQSLHRGGARETRRTQGDGSCEISEANV